MMNKCFNRFTTIALFLVGLAGVLLGISRDAPLAVGLSVVLIYIAWRVFE